MAYTLNRRLSTLVDSNGQLNTGKISNDYITGDHIADNVITAAMLHTSFTVSTSNLTSIDTDDVSEGSSNLYYTDARARGAVSATGSISYNSSTGVFSFTQGDTDTISEGSTNLYFTNERVDDRVNALLTAGTGITLTYDDGANTLTIAGAAQYGDSDVESYLDTNGLTLPDNVKAIFGAGSDLQIYHDGSNSYISEGGTGNLIIAADDFRVTNVAVSEVMIGADTDGVVSLYHNGSVKLTTLSTGINVTGSVVATSFSDGTISGITFIDEDSFTTNSATRVPTQQSIKAYVDTQVAGVVDSAPAALDTLNELAAALGDDANFSTTTSTALGNRLRVDTAAQGLTGTQQANAITNLGITATKAELNYVDGVTSNIQTQLNTKITSSDNITGTSGGLSGTPNITVGTISSGAITASSGITANGPFKSGGSNNYILFDYDGDFTGGNYYAIQDTSANRLRISYGFSATDNLELDSSGNFYVNGGNSTFAGTISSGAITSSGHIQSAGALKVTETGTAQVIMIGNQDSGGTNTPAMIMGVNGRLKFGYGNSWSGEGGTFTEVVNLEAGNLDISTGGLELGGQTVIDSSRNLTNIGNITVSGTVDGRDIATDGTKLDGIAANANNYSFPYTVSASASNNTVVQRHSSGYIYANYFNGTGTFSTTGATSGMGIFTGTNGTDTFGRSYTAAAARALLNVENGATADQTITLSGDASGSGTTSIAVTVLDNSHNHSSSSGDFTINGGNLYTGTSQQRVKLAVWSGTTYGIGMQAGYTFGGIASEYVLTNQMSDTNTRGFWWGDSGHTNAQGAMALTTQGYLTVANRIRVGYGESDTTTPSKDLDVSGEASIGSLMVGATTTPAMQLQVKDTTNYHGILVNGSSAPNVCFDRSTGTTPEWKVGISGNIGESFAISKGTANDDKLTIATDGETTIKGTKMNVVSSAEAVMGAQATGNSYWRVVADNSPNTYFQAGTGQTSSQVKMYFTGMFGSNNTMTVDTPNSRVGIGITSPGKKLDVRGTIRATAANNDISLSDELPGYGANSYGNLKASANNIYLAIGGSYIGYINSSAQLNASDSRLKENVATLTGALDKVNQLRGVSFNWIDSARGEGTHIGFIAQELEAVYPELVGDGGLPDDDDGQSAIKSVDYGHMVPVLVEAIKELKAENDALKARLDAGGL